ncbi:MAG: hypothetical protein WDO69_25080 [Pseudomonadota bacterium]
MSAKPYPEDVLVGSGGFWTRCALAVSMDDTAAGMELLRDMHACEGKIYLSIVPNTQERAALAAAAGFKGLPMPAKFGGTCAVCSGRFPAGAQILYDRDRKRAAHNQCGEIAE